MKFHAEIYQLMTTTINAFHENNEIFSKNASQTDRIYDKIRYELLKNAEVYAEQKKLKIDIHLNEEN
jgi:HSP90 family molecular chaperone